MNPTQVVGVCTCGHYMLAFERLYRLRDPASGKTVRMHELCFNRMVIDAREAAARRKNALVVKPTAEQVPELIKGRIY